MSKKLLLADDSITIQKVIQITFAHEDYELTITDNGDAALAKAQEVKPDLIMSDVYMPGKNGYELTSAVKQDPALQNVPVLLLAGSFEPFDEDKARSCKADAWIEKPFESQNLIDKVAELLNAAPEATEPAPAAEPGHVSQPEPVVAPEPLAAPEAATVEDFVVEEEPLAAFDETVDIEPQVAAAPEDPFGDISFEEEAAEPEVQPVVADDDWSDVAEETVVEEPVVENAFVEEPVAEIENDFSFAEEEALPVADFASAEEPPVAETELDVFDMGDEDIMPLGDDDILGEEDLEPAMPEQTLAAWSRDDAAEDPFAEPLAEVPAVEDEDVFADEEPVEEVADTFVAPVVEETSVFAEEPVVEEAPAFEETPAFQEPAVEAVPAFVEAVPIEDEPEPAVAAAAMADVEAKASGMDEDEIEQIIEKVVTKVVEKLAGSILERVAWEVVPDLAENLIREEIRKIKDTAA